MTHDAFPGSALGYNSLHISRAAPNAMMLHRHLLRSSLGRRLRTRATTPVGGGGHSYGGILWQYSTTARLSADAAEEEGGGGDDGDAPPPNFVVADRKRAAADFNNSRKAYQRAVSGLRKEYAGEIERQRQSDEAAEAKLRAALARRRLERQRAKNVRSVRNAAREEENRLKRQAEFEEELRVAQVNRDARNERFRRARQLVVDELEVEAPLWLTTPEEVDAALDADGAQALWGRPGGVVGAPASGDDVDFWRYECHTWDMSKTYQSPREILLKELEEMAYLEANIDDSYWTEERLRKASKLEDKAKLRAMVREEGRKALLQKQKRMMQDRFAADRTGRGATDSADDGGAPAVPKPMPAPKLDFLADQDALEAEGVKILQEDPSKFFRFEDGASASPAEGNEEGQAGGAHLGRPVGLRDPVREDSSGMLDGTSPYPSLIGRPPRPDTRTEKERKRDEREERMWAAAQEAQGGAGAKKGEDSQSIELAAEETIDDGSDPINYDEVGNSAGEHDLEWEEGLDPDLDADLLATPSESRYSEEDVDWVLEQLDSKREKLEDVVRFEKQSAEQEMRSRGNLGGKEEEEGEVDAFADALGGDATRSEGVDERGRKFVEYSLDSDDDDLDDASHEALRELDALADALSPEQLEAMEAIQARNLTAATDNSMSAEDIAEALSKVPGITKEQIESMIELDSKLKACFLGPDNEEET